MAPGGGGGGGGRGGLAVAVAFSRAAWPRSSLQAKKTYHVYHMESVNAEAKLREAERQEEKRAGRTAATAATATNEAGPVRKSSLKKGGRLVEKVGLEGARLRRLRFWPLSLRVPGPHWGLPGGGVWMGNVGLGRGQPRSSGQLSWLWTAPQAGVVDAGAGEQSALCSQLSPTQLESGELWCSRGCPPTQPPGLARCQQVAEGQEDAWHG